MTTNDIPKWFWKITAISIVGAAATLVLTGWSVGQFMGETQAWNRAQDERWNSHLEADDRHKDELNKALDKLGDRIALVPALAERLNSIDKRLDRLDNHPGHQ